MSNTFIAIPCMDNVKTDFFQSVISLKFSGSVRFGLSKNSLVYDARNKLVDIALESGFDRLMWLDSDMSFDPDTLLRLSADLDEGREFVTGLYFTRKDPCYPLIYTNLDFKEIGDNKVEPVAEVMYDYPKDQIFEVAGCGFGVCMMSMDLARRLKEQYGLPFLPMVGFGEDLTLCKRLTEMGVKMYCDSRIKAGHTGTRIFTEKDYLQGGEV